MKEFLYFFLSVFLFMFLIGATSIKLEPDTSNPNTQVIRIVNDTTVDIFKHKTWTK